MKIKDIDVTKTITDAKERLASDTSISAATRIVFELLIMVVIFMVHKYGANSNNSGTPPSQDPNRTKKKRENTGKKPGGQKGHIGTTLELVDNPDEIIELPVDKTQLPEGSTFTAKGYQSRQVFHICLKAKVIEYRAEILEDEHGKRYVATFPDDVKAHVQYGSTTKAFTVYLSVFQMLPYERIHDVFAHQIYLPISTGTVANCNDEASKRLAAFAEAAKKALTKSDIVHHDETSVNIAGKKHWLHSASNPLWTLFCVHEKRGIKAMTAITADAK